MSLDDFDDRLEGLRRKQASLVERPNKIDPNWSNGLFERYQFPVLTAAHVPINWRYDLDRNRNPLLIERLGVNAVFNPGAIEIDHKFYLVARIEGYDRKSFFAVAESKSGIDGFQFWDYPILMPELKEPDTNVYDIRLTKHEDGWIYGVFCTERKDPHAPQGDTSSAIAQAGIARTHDLITWERLPDLKTGSPQQRNVVLHPEIVDGKYAFYTRPMDEFISVGGGGGIGWGLCADITNPVIENETIIDYREYHTIKELKNGAGAPPIKTSDGWIHFVHGVRGTAAGLRYVLYAFLCDLQHPDQIKQCPGGYFLAPEGEERLGDVSNVVFCNGVICKEDGSIYIYYGSSDTRIHVATTSVEKMLDYLSNTPQDGLRSAISVQQRMQLIRRNQVG